MDFCQISLKSILTISSYTVLELGRFLRHSVVEFEWRLETKVVQFSYVSCALIPCDVDVGRRVDGRRQRRREKDRTVDLWSLTELHLTGRRLLASIHLILSASRCL